MNRGPSSQRGSEALRSILAIAWSALSLAGPAVALEEIQTSERAAALASSAWTVSPVAAQEAIEELPVAYRCTGNEPFWGLEIEGPHATYSALGEPERALAGSSRSLDYAGLFVYRGSVEGGPEWVAFILHQSCTDTMAEESEGGGRMPFAIGLSLPGGDARIGCCRPLIGPASPAGPAGDSDDVVETDRQRDRGAAIAEQGRER